MTTDHRYPEEVAANRRQAALLHDYLAEPGLATALFCAVRLPQPVRELKGQLKAAREGKLFSPTRVRRALTVSRLLAPVVVPLVYRASISARGLIDERRAERLGVPFADTDALIEAAAGGAVVWETAQVAVPEGSGGAWGMRCLREYGGEVQVTVCGFFTEAFRDHSACQRVGLSDAEHCGLKGG